MTSLENTSSSWFVRSWGVSPGSGLSASTSMTEDASVLLLPAEPRLSAWHSSPSLSACCKHINTHSLHDGTVFELVSTSLCDLMWTELFHSQCSMKVMIQSYLQSCSIPMVVGNRRWREEKRRRVWQMKKLTKNVIVMHYYTLYNIQY